MIDSDAATLALRNRMLTLVAATTGAVSLSATATGYARASGSFLTDGFRDGLEFLAAGFGTAGNNGSRVIENVSALTITTSAAVAQPTAEVAGAGRTLSVGIPVGRAFENRVFSPVSGRPFIEEDFVPGGHALFSFPAQGGTVEETGLYVVKYYGLEGKGTGAIRRFADALKALFTPGTVLPVGSVRLRVRGDASVTSGQILPQGDGWAVCSTTVPWRAYSQNAVAV